MGTAADETDAATSVVDGPPMGNFVGVACYNMLVVVPYVVLGDISVLEPCDVGRFVVVGNNNLEPVVFGAHHVFFHSWVGQAWNGFDGTAWVSGMSHWCGHHQCCGHLSNNC